MKPQRAACLHRCVLDLSSSSIIDDRRPPMPVIRPMNGRHGSPFSLTSNAVLLLGVASAAILPSSSSPMFSRLCSSSSSMTSSSSTGCYDNFNFGSGCSCSSPRMHQILSINQLIIASSNHARNANNQRRMVER